MHIEKHKSKSLGRFPTKYSKQIRYVKHYLSNTQIYYKNQVKM